MKNYDYLIYVDGGCLNNGSSDSRAYGSFLVDGESSSHRLQFPNLRTNNEAEYAALISALEYCLHRNILNATVRMDSRLVVEQVNGAWRVREPRLLKFWNHIIALRRKFLSCRIEYAPREEIVSFLGH